MLNRSSRTAQHVTLFRAIEAARRRDRVIDDPYAARFLTGPYGLLARVARVPLAHVFEVDHPATLAAIAAAGSP